MQPRKLLLTVLAGGPVLGLLMGLAANPGMAPPPEPAWRTARPDPIFTESQRFVDAGPQDLSPLITDRTPTWKRHPAERQTAAWRDETEPADEPATETMERSEPQFEAAAAEQDAARDAQAAPAADAAAQPDAPPLIVIQAGA